MENIKLETIESAFEILKREIRINQFKIKNLETKIDNIKQETKDYLEIILEEVKELLNEL